MASQIVSDKNALIAIPVLRELDISVANVIDSLQKTVNNGLIKVGTSISGISPVGDVAGVSLALLGTFIGETENFIGDVMSVGTSIVGKVCDGVKTGAAAVTNGIVDAWNWLFG